MRESLGQITFSADSDAKQPFKIYKAVLEIEVGQRLVKITDLASLFQQLHRMNFARLQLSQSTISR